ncbi:patatin-like phospholipase family protein [Streptomyces sp. NPDC094143]|uniref:patatin-like phospholipase family protein n=1 Tax=Streptomyces sp. NPDC094143 TaxID=3155310 RepID=UPI0033291A1A
MDKDTKVLVLGGGGVAGIAWETGILAGLADAGVYVTDADLVVGTSAGATVAAQATNSKPPSALYDCRSVVRSSRPGSRITSGPRGASPSRPSTRSRASSSRVWPAVPIRGRRLFDGGMRSGTNADVAKDYGKVLVLDVIGFPETTDVEPVSAPLLTVTPGEASQAGLQNLLDPDSRAICARAGYDQGQRIAAEVKAFWA